VQPMVRAVTLVPRDFAVVDAMSDEAGTLIMVRSVAGASPCSGCGTCRYSQ